MNVPVARDGPTKGFSSCLWRRKPNPNPTPSVIVEEADAGLFEGGLDAHQGRYVTHDRAFLALNAPDGGDTDFCRFGEVILVPAQKGPSCTDLRGLKH